MESESRVEQNRVHHQWYSINIVVVVIITTFQVYSSQAVNKTNPFPWQALTAISYPVVLTCSDLQ